MPAALRVARNPSSCPGDQFLVLVRMAVSYSVLLMLQHEFNVINSYSVESGASNVTDYRDLDTSDMRAFPPPENNTTRERGRAQKRDPMTGWVR